MPATRSRLRKIIFSQPFTIIYDAAFPALARNAEAGIPPADNRGRVKPSSAKPRRIRLGADAYRGNSIELGLHAPSPWYAPSGPIRGKPGNNCHL
jgi:hypothetical protein